MKKQRVFLSALTALLLLPGCQSTPTQGKTTVILATGPTDGYYQKVCTAMREVGRDQGLEINCLSSKAHGRMFTNWSGTKPILPSCRAT
jgi:TRAP-type uncharacterized transport system substrate-binding protein